MPKLSPEVLRFFLAHPSLSESLEGVARWRLRDEIIRRTVDEVTEAMVWLVAERFLREIHDRPTSMPLFALNRARIAAARRLVADAEIV